MKLKWGKTSYQGLAEMRDSYFYAFFRGSVLLYIGIAYNQNVKNEIKNTIQDFDISRQGLTLWLSYIEKTDFRRITEQIIKDVECLLIFTHKPSYNTHCKFSYAGRDNLKVKNRGCPFFKSCVKVERDYIYDKC